MSLALICDGCGVRVETSAPTGAFPVKGALIETVCGARFHLCEECYTEVLAYLREKRLEKAAGER